MAPAFDLAASLLNRRRWREHNVEHALGQILSADDTFGRIWSTARQRASLLADRPTLGS